MCVPVPFFELGLDFQLYESGNIENDDADAGVAFAADDAEFDIFIYTLYNLYISIYL